MSQKLVAFLFIVLLMFGLVSFYVFLFGGHEGWSRYLVAIWFGMFSLVIILFLFDRISDRQR